jgi:hypothetical protein
MAQVSLGLRKLSDEDFGAVLGFLLSANRMYSISPSKVSIFIYRCENDFVEIEVLRMWSFVVVRLLQGCNVAVTSGDGIGERDNAASPSRASQAGANAEILRDANEFVKIFMAALVQRLQ